MMNLKLTLTSNNIWLLSRLCDRFLADHGCHRVNQSNGFRYRLDQILCCGHGPGVVTESSTDKNDQARCMCLLLPN